MATTIKKSDTGSGGWLDATSNLTYGLQAGDDSMFFLVTSNATDDADQSMNSNSAVVGPVITPTEIKVVTVTVDGALTEDGELLYCTQHTPLAFEAAISGDANPSYKWEARGNYQMVVEAQAAITTLTFQESRRAAVTLTVTDPTAKDSPFTYEVSFNVAPYEGEEVHRDA